jgi:translation initiation factor 1
MNEVCPKCGLPSDLCVCETIAKEAQQIVIKIVKRKFGKLITVVTGIDEKSINLKDLAKKLKSKFACGGTAKEGQIELQGNHIKKVKQYLIELGFPADTITTNERW